MAADPKPTNEHRRFDLGCQSTPHGAMYFVRCECGWSHGGFRSVEERDAAIAAHATEQEARHG